MSRVEIENKAGILMGVIDDLTGTVEMTEEWKQILQQRKPADETKPEPQSEDSDEEEDDEEEDEDD